MAKFKDVLKRFGKFILSDKKNDTTNVKNYLIYNTLDRILSKNNNNITINDDIVKRIISITLKLVKDLTLNPDIDKRDIGISNMLQSDVFIKIVTKDVINQLKRYNSNG